ncbi:MAG: hypothetical protein LBB17_01095 [Puniceicoccales bacterium]|nr:hypothetical protein [Puniceicoccales bacterium]
MKNFDPLLPSAGTVLRAYFAFFPNQIFHNIIDCGGKWEILFRSGDFR